MVYIRYKIVLPIHGTNREISFDRAYHEYQGEVFDQAKENYVELYVQNYSYYYIVKDPVETARAIKEFKDCARELSHWESISENEFTDEYISKIC